MDQTALAIAEAAAARAGMSTSARLSAAARRGAVRAGPAPTGATRQRRRQTASTVRRGEPRRYTRPSTPDQPRSVVLVSSDGINDSSRPWLLGIELRDRDPGGTCSPYRSTTGAGPTPET